MSAYSAAVIADTPVHYWRAAEPGGHILHDNGSSPLLLVGSNPNQLGYSGPNTDGGSFDVSIAGLWANTGIAVSIPLNPLSVECIAWKNYRDASIRVAVLGLSGAASWSIIANATDHYQAFYNGVGVAAAPTLAVQAWVHHVLTYDGTNLRYYINGAFINLAAVGPIAAGNTRVTIGTNDTQGQNWFGLVSEFALYNTALSAARVLTHFNAIDNSVTPPFFQVGGSVSPTTGGVVVDSAQLALIYAAVHRVY